MQSIHKAYPERLTVELRWQGGAVKTRVRPVDDVLTLLTGLVARVPDNAALHVRLLKRGDRHVVGVTKRDSRSID